MRMRDGTLALLPHALGRPHGWRVGAALDEEKAAREGAEAAEGEKRHEAPRFPGPRSEACATGQAHRLSHPHRAEQGASCGPAYFILAKRRSATSSVVSMHRRRGGARR